MKVVFTSVSSKTATVIDEQGESHIYKANTENYRKIVEEVLPQLKTKDVVDFNPNSELQVLKDMSSIAGFTFFKTNIEMLKNCTLESLQEIKGYLDSISEVDLKQILEAAQQTLCVLVDGKPIPYLEKLLPYFNWAIKNNSAESIKNFLNRVKHLNVAQISQLFEFLSEADLPLAKDGTIIAYKRLDRQEDYYVDCHSHLIHQKVGTYVSILPCLVDTNPDHECSKGLHIARRSYLKSFGGDVLTLVRVEPEKLIAVPREDFNKMRVYSYLIIAELTDKETKLIESDMPMTDSPSGKKLLSFAYEAPFKITSKATQINGSTVEYENFEEEVKDRQEGTNEMEALSPVKKDEYVNTKDDFIKATNKERLRMLFQNLNQENAQKMIDIVKKSKRSLRSFGFSENEIILIYHYIKQ